MLFPNDLATALENLLSKVSRSALTEAANDLRCRYRSNQRDKIPTFMISNHHRLSYLAVRMPATFAAVKKVLLQCKNRVPGFHPKTLCDIGAGPGTASWASLEVFSGIEAVTLHEKDPGWLQIGKSLMEQSLKLPLKKAVWNETDIVRDSDFARHDLVILSYVIGELSLESLKKIISQAWDASSYMLVIIEPGTPHGFERIQLVRDQLIQAGAYLVAPCPHHDKCPMDKGNWCHFAARLERSSFHKSIKDVSLGYEDEKFSYIIFCKSLVALPEARILRHPQHHSGHMEFVLCSQRGVEEKTISRRQKDLYKQAKKLEWGDDLNV